MFLQQLRIHLCWWFNRRISFDLTRVVTAPMQTFGAYFSKRAIVDANI